MRTLLSIVVVSIALPLFAQNALIDQGKAALARGDAKAAADLFEKAVAQSPNSAEAHFNLGSAYGSLAQRAGLFSAASLAGKTRKEFERAVALDPNFIDARFALLEFYAVAPGFMGGSFDKAFQQAAEIRRRDALRGHQAYSFIYSQQKKPELAKKEYLDAIREQPTSVKARYYLATYVLGVEKNYAGATAELEAVLKLDPAFMPAWYQLGRAAALSGSNLPRGEEALRKYLAYSPRSEEPSLARAHLWLGTVLEKTGRKTDAKLSYAAALKLNPNLKEAAEGLQRLSR